MKGFLNFRLFFLAGTPLFSLAFLSIVPGAAKSFQDLPEFARNTRWNHNKMEIKVNAYNFLPGITFSFYLSPLSLTLFQFSSRNILPMIHFVGSYPSHREHKTLFWALITELTDHFPTAGKKRNIPLMFPINIPVRGGNCLGFWTGFQAQSSILLIFHSLSTNKSEV